MSEHVVQRRERRIVLAGGELDRDQERAVGAGPESFREEVIGAAGGEVRLAVTGVGEREAHRKQGQCKHDEDAKRGGAGPRRSSLHNPAPFPREGVTSGRVTPTVQDARNVESVDAGADEAEDGRQQAEGGAEDQHDARDRSEREAVHEREAQKEESEQ